MNKASKTDLTIEPQKVLAERINGWAAMLGFFAAIGAYLTTGQIIPGVI
ncbi:high light inducible protein [Prochlorococcus sp. MIT 1300]|nr:high light inducible protein [Prochlorococcus sp. MIT 1300]